MYDPIIRSELLAVALGLSDQCIKRRAMTGKIPSRDARIDGKIQAWKLSTLAAWNPRVAERIDGLLKSPYLPAA